VSTPDLTPVSYVVLGLLARDGPSTPYDLKVAVGRGIAHFWPFPHSQIYSETERLARLGLLEETREDSGRRRRIYRITEAGRAALAAWLAEPTSERPQLRSLALLKLFFGHFARPEDVVALAAAQLEMHRQQLDAAAQRLERLRARPDRRWQLAVAEIHAEVARAMAEQWARIEAIARDEACSRPSQQE
jgi:PadR family transcriptional regulator AphA